MSETLTSVLTEVADQFGSIAHFAFIPKWKRGKSNRIFCKKIRKDGEWKTLMHLRLRMYHRQVQPTLEEKENGKC